MRFTQTAGLLNALSAPPPTIFGTLNCGCNGSFENIRGSNSKLAASAPELHGRRDSMSTDSKEIAQGVVEGSPDLGAAVRMLLRCKSWANEGFFESISTIPLDEADKSRPTAFGNIVQTLNHVHVVDDIFRHHHRRPVALLSSADHQGRAISVRGRPHDPPSRKSPRSRRALVVASRP